MYFFAKRFFLLLQKCLPPRNGPGARCKNILLGSGKERERERYAVQNGPGRPVQNSGPYGVQIRAGPLSRVWRYGVDNPCTRLILTRAGRIVFSAANSKY